MTGTSSTESRTPEGHIDPWLHQTAVIQTVKSELEGVFTCQLAFQDTGFARQYQFEPGQFNMLYLPGFGEAAISMSGDPDARGTLVHTIRAVGNVTRGLAALRPGDTLGVRGPFGSSWPLDECRGQDVVLVTGGIGLPPLRPVIYRLLREPEHYGRLHLLYGARTPETQLYRSEYDAWRVRGLSVATTVDRASPGWRGNIGVVTTLLERLESFDPKRTVLFCCGPEVMMRYVARTAGERGLSFNRIWVSVERNMQCAIRHCGHCQLGPWFLCHEGPVFRYDRIAPYMNVEGL